MAARITVERIQRDDDDSSGQSIRSWKLESEIDFITIRINPGSGFILLRTTDVDAFITDLKRAAAGSISLSEEPR